MLSKATGVHFNQKGHRISDMEISVVENFFNNDAFESYLYLDPNIIVLIN